MPILDVNLASIVSEGELDDTTETEVYMVVTDHTETARSVRTSNHPELPQRRDVHVATSLTALRIAVQILPDSGGGPGTKRAFTYTVTWGIPPEEEDDENILNRVEIQWEGLEFSEFSMVDAEGTPFRNSAGDPYNPQPERIVMGGACIIVRNQLVNPANTCVTFSNSTNASNWYGVAKGFGKFGVIAADREIDPVVGRYWRVAFPIQFNRKGWRLMAIDNGFNEKVSSKLERICDEMIDEDGVRRKVPRNIPSYLNGSGRLLSDGGTPVVFPDAGFVMSEETNWGSLGLPNPFA